MPKAAPFAPTTPLFNTLKRKVDEHLEQEGLPRKGERGALLKAAIVLGLFVASYVALVFWASSPLQVVACAFALSQAIILIGFNIMHDGGHDAFSSRPWVNRLMGLGLDLVGGNQWLWRHKHGFLHHSYTNLEGLDDDLDTNGLLRLHPEQPWRPWHRYQAWYALPVYSLLMLHWVVSDFFEFFGRRIGEHAVRAPGRKETVIFLAFKANFFFFAFVLPMLFHPWYWVLATFTAIFMVGGIVSSVTFQLAHVVDSVDAPASRSETSAERDEWMVHQLRTTTDFAPRNRLLTWYMGGLNFQAIHHLFPRISHLRYPTLQPVVKQHCEENGVPYRCFRTLRGAIASHFRQLNRLGSPGAAAAHAVEPLRKAA